MRLSKSVFLITAALLAISPVAFGSGFGLYEQGAKATAMGGAFAATADDPSAIFYNVAGIAQQRQFTILGGGAAINFANEFRGDPNDPFTSGTTAQYKNHTFIPPNAYVIAPVGQNLTVGLGVFTPFGLRTNWADPYPGRFISKDANIKTISIEPALAWQSGDGRVALGFGAEYRRSHIVLSRNLAPTGSGTNPFNGRIVDIANAFLNSDWDNAWGWNVGILLKPNSTWRIGASYRSEMTINYKGDAVFTQIPTGSAQLDGLVASQLPPNQRISTSIKYPGIAVLGIANTAIPNWDIEADITQTTWSRFKALDIAFTTTPSANIHRDENWKNTFSYRLGANRRVNDSWDVRLGAVYDKNPEPTAVVGPLLPDADRTGVSFGVGYHHGPFIVDLTDFVLHFKKRSTDGQSADFFNGTYKTDANLISVNLGYKF